MQILPYQMSDILSKDPFDYKGIEWIKKLMYLFHKYPNIDQMNDHFMEIAKIVAENFSLSERKSGKKFLINSDLPQAKETHPKREGI